MSTMYGADIAQLRALANQFDRNADQLDWIRGTVGTAIQISAWQGPEAGRFRSQWSSDYASRITLAVRLLHDGANRLRANADGQERASAVDGGWSGLVPGLPGGLPWLPGEFPGRPGGPGPQVGPEDQWWDWAAPWWDGFGQFHELYGAFTAPAELASFFTAAGFLAKNVRGASSIKSLGLALQFSDDFKLVDEVSDVLHLGKGFGTAMGWAGVGLDAIDTVKNVVDGDYEAAIWSGVKTGIGIAAMVTPVPVNLVFGAVGIGMTAWEHREEIASFVNNTAEVVSDVAEDVGEAVGKAAEGFVEGVGKVADALWPF